MGEGSALPGPRRPAQLKFSDSLLVAPPKLHAPLSQKGSSKPSQSLLPGPVGVPGSLTPWFGSPSLCELCRLSSACGATGRVRLCCSNKYYFTGFLTADLSFQCLSGWNLLPLSPWFSSCNFVSSLPLDCQYFLVPLCPVVHILRSLVDDSCLNRNRTSPIFCAQD